MSKLIYGVGTNSRGKHKATINGTNTSTYDTWRHMLQRAYCPKLHARQPTYIGCSVADDWLEYQDFGDWFENHEYGNRGYHLDKDLLLPGNKVYAPDRCVFVPQELNKLLIDCGAIRGQHPQGVSFHKARNKFQAGVTINGKKQHLGYFETELEAYNAYKIAKEAHVKNMASHWKNDIAANVYEALMRWELEDAK